MTLNGVMALILPYFTKFMYDVVRRKTISRLILVSKTTFDGL